MKHLLQQSTTLSRNQLQQGTMTNVTLLSIFNKVHYNMKLYSIVVLRVRCLLSRDHHISIVTSCPYLPQVDRARLITSGRGSNPPSRGDHVLLHLLSLCSLVSLTGKKCSFQYSCFLGCDAVKPGRNLAKSLEEHSAKYPSETKVSL